MDIKDGTGFSEFWKTCPELPWYKAMQKFHKLKDSKKTKNLYCPQCGDTVTDEECPHWDYEYDPRVKL